MITQGDKGHPVQLNDHSWGYKITEVHWTSGLAVLTIDYPEGIDLSFSKGYFPVEGYSPSDTIDIHADTGSYFFAEGAFGTREDWAVNPIFPGTYPLVISNLYDITVPPVDAWTIDSYIDEPADRTTDQDTEFAANTAAITASLGYDFTNDYVGAYLVVDKDTTGNPASDVWIGTGDYPLPQIITKQLTAPMSGREFRYWIRYTPTPSSENKRNLVRQIWILNTIGAMPDVFKTPMTISQDAPIDDPNLPLGFNINFQLDIYSSSTLLTMNANTITGPDAQRTYSQSRLVPYTQSGVLVTINKSGFSP